MLAAAVELDAPCLGQRFEAALRLNVEIALGGIKPHEHAAWPIILRIIILESWRFWSDVRPPVAHPHGPAKRRIRFSAEVPRIELRGDIEIERPFVERLGVSAGHETAEDLACQTLIDDLRHVTGKPARRIRRLAQNAPGVPDAAIIA